MPTVRLTLPRPHPAQAEVARGARRFNVLVCGRRFGKTTFEVDRLIPPALSGAPVAWFSPTYKMLAEVWRDLRRVLLPVTTRVNAQEHRLELVTGGTVDMWSLDQPDAARGRKYARVAVDEAAMVVGLEEAWQAVIRPTLADYQGGAWFGSTPKGVNYFHALFAMGQDPALTDWASWQLPTSANPYIAPEEIEAARRELPELVFRQEYLAEFLQAEGAVFRNIDACMVAGEATPAEHRTHAKVMGVDWARESDFTALSVGCLDCRRELALDRFNKIEWAFQRARLRALVERWGVGDILAEANSIGGPNIEALQHEGLKVRPFDTTTTSKAPLIQSLSLALENEEWAWLADPTAKAELVAYEGRVNRVTGRVSYSAPEGGHDDTVIARALVVWAANNQPRKFGWV